MDSFWANVNREFKKLHSDKIPQIAYGSAIITMKPTGKGETAVPTGSMFSSCKLASPQKKTTYGLIQIHTD